MEYQLINLTQHNLTSDQINDFKGDIVKLNDKGNDLLKSLLTFTSLPSSEEITNRAKKLARLAEGGDVTHALIGGAPYLMGPLEKELVAVGITPLYSYSERVSVETTNSDGEVVKTNVFKHVGFVGDAPTTHRSVSICHHCNDEYVYVVDGKLECGHN